MNKFTKGVDIGWNGGDHRPDKLAMKDRLTIEPDERTPASRPQGRKMGDSNRFKVRRKK